jgi:hypothetical protein
MKRAASIHIKALMGVLIILVLILAILNPVSFLWLKEHPVFDIFVGALVAVFHLYNTYDREHLQ